LKASNFIRVVASALVLSTLSFAAGVAGDLSLADGPTSGARVVLRIPPELPSDTVRARPLVSTSTAEAVEIRYVAPARLRAPRFESIDMLDAAPFDALDVLTALPKASPLVSLKGERQKRG
jgi:hypothetical protein